MEKYLNKLDPSGNLFAEYTHYQNTLTNLGGPELIGTNSYNEKRISERFFNTYNCCSLVISAKKGNHMP